MRQKEKKEANLGEDRIGGLLFKLALPAILAQVINLLYNLVDRMYIGHIAFVPRTDDVVFPCSELNLAESVL